MHQQQRSVIAQAASLVVQHGPHQAPQQFLSRLAAGGFPAIAYQNAIKVEMLAVPQQLIDEHGVVSSQVAEAMAVGCRTRLKADLAVSTVGVAGPGDLGPDRPAGLVFVGLAWEGGASATSFSWSGTREEVQRRSAKLALNRVRLHLSRPGERGA